MLSDFFLPFSSVAIIPFVPLCDKCSSKSGSLLNMKTTQCKQEFAGHVMHLLLPDRGELLNFSLIRDLVMRR